jgi:hypothetical protein
MTYPRRDKYSYWHNKEPVTDKYEALGLLADQNSSTRPIHLTKNDEHGWEVVYPWFRDGDSGGCASGDDYFQIDQPLAQSLVNERLVEPFVEKGWGWSRPNPRMLVLARSAREDVRRYEREMQARALTMLILGVHTDLTGQAVSNGWGRESWRTGPLHFDFKSPSAQICRVYPEENRIVYPYE